MKILIINKYQDTVSRGAETYVAELSKRLNKDIKVDIISGGDVNITEWKKTFLWRFFLDKNSLEILNFTLKNLSKIWKQKYDVVIPMNSGWQSFLVRIVTWLYGGKVLISGQSGKGWHERINLLTFPNVFVTLSSYSLNWAKKVNPFVKSVYIPNGVDLNSFKVKSKVNNQKIKTILTVGAFTEQKRHELVIKAVAKIKNTKLIISGWGGDLKDKLYQLAISKLGKDRFEIIKVPHNKMPEIYNRSDIFTLASNPSESFGIVLVEAMASGLPVVATDDPIRREIVGDAGLFVDPTDTEAYANALEKALNTSWGNKPRKQAEKFSWDKIALQYEKLFKEL